MTIRLYLLCSFLAFSNLSLAQITFRGCTASVMGAQDFTLSNTGTVTDASIVRNTFEATPNDFTQGCPAGVCEARIIWSIANTRWEIQLDNDGPVGTPDYTTSVLYFNTAASHPNPPDLTLGTWVDGAGGLCPIGEFVTFSGDVQSTLPVALTYFSGILTKDEISLSWETAVEINNDYFQVERKVGEREFEMIGTITGAGNSKDTHTYQFTDRSPGQGLNYYRLKQVDFDGQFEYSKVIQFRNSIKGNQVGEFYPNPSSSSSPFLDYYSESRRSISIEVYDFSGRLLQKEQKSINPGQHKVALQLETIGKGIFMVKIISGQHTSYRKLVLK